MRILICTNAYPPHFVGGAELVAHQVALQMTALGHEVAVFAGKPVHEDAPATLEHDVYDGLPVYRCARTRQDYDVTGTNYVDLKLDRQFQTVLRDFRPDVVHAHNLLGLSARILILAAEAGARVFLTFHDFWGFCLRNTLMLENETLCADWSGCENCLPPARTARPPLRLRQDLLAVAFDHVDRFICPSAFVRDKYIAAGFPIEYSALVRNGIDTALFAAVSPLRPRSFSAEDPLRLMFAGYLGSHKGVHLLPRVIAAMRHRGKIRLELYGEGPHDLSLRAQIAQLGLGSVIRFKGKLQPEAMVGAYECNEALVLPSIWSENQPVCIMEAMACGRPIIASRIGGIPEMIDHGREGFLCAPGDVPALAAALDRLIEAPQQVIEMGARARARVAEQSYRQQAENLLDLFVQEGRSGETRRPARPVVAIPAAENAAAFVPDRGDQTQYILFEDWLTPGMTAEPPAPLRGGHGGRSFFNRRSR